MIKYQYGPRLMRGAFAALAPFKRLFGEPDARTHIAITATALSILLRDGYHKECEFFRNGFWAIEKGLVWADAGLKSAGHFYFPYGRRRGLRGQHTAMNLAEKYHDNAIKLMKMGEMDIALLYVGAALHLIQDAGIPQHATISLLDGHRRYEKYVRNRYLSSEHEVSGPAVQFDEPREFIQFNARIALKVQRHLAGVQDEAARFERMYGCMLPVGERSSAGYMLCFYRLANRMEKPMAKPYKLSG